MSGGQLLARIGEKWLSARFEAYEGTKSIGGATANNRAGCPRFVAGQQVIRGRHSSERARWRVSRFLARRVVRAVWRPRGRPYTSLNSGNSPASRHCNSGLLSMHALAYTL